MQNQKNLKAESGDLVCLGSLYLIIGADLLLDHNNMLYYYPRWKVEIFFYKLNSFFNPLF